MARPVELGRSRGCLGLGAGPREPRRLTFGISTQLQSSRAVLPACPVAAPQQQSGPSSAPDLTVVASGADSAVDVQQQLASLISADASTARRGRLDVPSAPSTSGRSRSPDGGARGSGRDRPSTRDRPSARRGGSGRRTGAGAGGGGSGGGGDGRRVSGSGPQSGSHAASFYGEYVDGAATKLVVARVWERIMSESRQQQGPQQQQQQPPPPQQQQGQGQAELRAAAARDGAEEVEEEAGAPDVEQEQQQQQQQQRAALSKDALRRHQLPPPPPPPPLPEPRQRGRASAGTSATTTTASGRGPLGATALRRAAADTAAAADAAAEAAAGAGAWSVSARAPAAPATGALAGTARTGAVVASPSSSSARRVSLYLGPQYELELPTGPAPAPASGSSSNDIGSSVGSSGGGSAAFTLLYDIMGSGAAAAAAALEDEAEAAAGAAAAGQEGRPGLSAAREGEGDDEWLTGPGPAWELSEEELRADMDMEAQGLGLGLGGAGAAAARGRQGRGRQGSGGLGQGRVRTVRSAHLSSPLQVRLVGPPGEELEDGLDGAGAQEDAGRGRGGRGGGGPLRGRAAAASASAASRAGTRQHPHHQQPHVDPLHTQQAHYAAAAQRQMARQRDLVEALVGRRDDAEVAERIRLLAAVNRSGVTAVNAVLGVLGDMGHVHALSRLLGLAVGLGAYNEHTYASAFRGLYRAGRLGMALSAFEEACRSGRDLGPVACSALLHIMAQERNLRLAWQLFDQMVAARMTLNRYAYNCMAHLASLHGALDDTLLLYNMMKSEARQHQRLQQQALQQQQAAAAVAAAPGEEADAAAAEEAAEEPHVGAAFSGSAAAGGGAGTAGAHVYRSAVELTLDCSPDAYTYSALVRAAVTTGRGDLLPALFNEMAASQRAADRAAGRPRRLAPGEGEGRLGLSTEVWGHFISAASRTGQPELAMRFFEAGISELGLLPSTPIYNAALAAMARAGRPLGELMVLYREMVGGCSRPLPQGQGQQQQGQGQGQQNQQQAGGSAATRLRRRGQRSAAAAAEAEAEAEPAAAATAAAPDGAAAGPQHEEGPGVVVQPPLRPDAYTFNALLTAAAHDLAPLAAVHGVRSDMAAAGVRLNTYVGTSLINALRKTPELSRAGGAGAGTGAGGAGGGGAAAVVSEAEAVMSELVAGGAASATSYICMAALYAAARRPADVLRVVREMAAAGVAADASSWEFLVTAVGDADLFGLVPQLQRAAEAQARAAERAAAAAAAEASRRRQQGRQQGQAQAQGQSGAGAAGAGAGGAAADGAGDASWRVSEEGQRERAEEDKRRVADYFGRMEVESRRRQEERQQRRQQQQQQQQQQH
ncbi:hypothetical protein HXX76_008062 [Chlamydomonas incerta]|uniref:Pentacotripeptide-repeat region of PRORP domain-containing protein n=1 Tax=Chlamydomonas incerta TaxID=51695 RepID=A0A835VY81_CHLIN|nr:hypothetical protein HXX76_008062 [Chlamydomonas incerta]|eukprot:KAG2433692.1 hypothetical protein HXX76_008062 [Chlamydomonas incerta]